MQNNNDFQAIFDLLHKSLAFYSEKLICVTDTSDDFHLNTPHIMKNKKPLFFGAVKINKNYVSYHLMPVYVFPELLTTLSPDLKRRMQGKSCFNFKKIDPILFDELTQLTAASFSRFSIAKYIKD